MKILRDIIFSSGLIGHVLLLAFLIMAVFSTTTYAQDTSGNRLEAAYRYVKTSDVQKMMNEMTEQIALNLPENKREAFIQYMTESLDLQMIESMMVTSMVQHFTVNELNALADFYGSPEGVSIMKKMPAYMATVMPMLQSKVINTAKTFK